MTPYWRAEDRHRLPFSLSSRMPTCRWSAPSHQAPAAGGSGGMLSSSHCRLTRPVTPCTRRQPGRGRVGRGGALAGAGPGQQPSAAGALALHSSKPTAHTPARSGWIQQREDSLCELPGCREGTESISIFLIEGERWPPVSHDLSSLLFCFVWDIGWHQIRDIV